MKTFQNYLGLLLTVIVLPLAAAESPWQRVVVVGASASAGFMISEPFGGTNSVKCKLRYYLDAALTPEHAPLQDFSTAMMFLNPEGIGAQQIAKATNSTPTLVVGVDFLFWFCYGKGTNEAERAQRFEKGLQLLETFRCPLLVGDIPDMSSATNTGILSPAQVPSAAARTAANQRLKTWAAGRPQVTLISLEQLTRAVAAHEPARIHGRTLPWEANRPTIQDDQLHPNPLGAALLALEIYDALTAHQPKLPAQDIRWDENEVYQRGYQASGQPNP